MAHNKKTKNTRAAAAKGRKQGLPVWLWAVAVAVVIVVILAVAALSNPGTAVNSNGSESASLPKEISVSEASQKRDTGAFILDVREPEEWQAGHIPDATLIPLGQLQSRLSEIPKDQEVVVVCRSGNRSAQGRDILLQAGFLQVTSMAGGMNDWQSQGLPVVTGQ